MWARPTLWKGRSAFKNASNLFIYKTVLSKITGIARDDIKDSVCNRIQAGISEDVVDENGNIVTRRRSLTDEEAKLIVTYINQMSDEDVERFVGESNAQLEQKTL